MPAGQLMCAESRCANCQLFVNYCDAMMPTGRVSVFAEPDTASRAAGKKGGAWAYATHDLASLQDIQDSIRPYVLQGTEGSGAKLMQQMSNCSMFNWCGECWCMCVAVGSSTNDCSCLLMHGKIEHAGLLEV